MDALFGVIVLPVRKHSANNIASVQPILGSPKGKSKMTALEAVCSPSLRIETRVDIVAEATMLSLRQRHAEIKRAIEDGDDNARAALVAFERRYGLRRKYRYTWRALFLEQEDDETRFTRKVRRRIRHDLLRADAIDEEIKEYKHEADKSRQLTEFARLEKLSQLEQNIYLRNRLDEGTKSEDTLYVSRDGRYLALFVLAIFISFPMYFTLAVSQVAQSPCEAIVHRCSRHCRPGRRRPQTVGS